MTLCFFVSDLHGCIDRYRKLMDAIRIEKPAAVLFGGDLLPHGSISLGKNRPKSKSFASDFLIPEFKSLQIQLGANYPAVFLILGNDDGRFEEKDILQGETGGLWKYIHNRSIRFGEFTIFGYAFVPPTPFLLKDWERYDVSRFVDPGCISPEDGWRTDQPPENEVKFATIQKDLEKLAGDSDLSKAVFLFHSPPYRTNLDRAALDGKMIDHVPVDVHVGSLAIRRFIEQRQPILTLHGHIHESTHLTGSWRDQIGQTLCFNAAHHGPELALIRFDLEKPGDATRELR